MARIGLDLSKSIERRGKSLGSTEWCLFFAGTGVDVRIGTEICNYPGGRWNLAGAEGRR
jgi:hypothetical protein